MTDPGPPPEEALDATLRALAAPVPAQARRTPESAGLDNAHYHAEAHRPPKAHEAPPSSKASTTDPMSAALTPLVRDTARMKPMGHRADLTTVPRAAPPPSRMSTFLAALVFVVAVLGIATWALMRGGPAQDRAGVATSAQVPSANGNASAYTVAAPVPAPPAPAPTFVASADTSSATADPPRPTGRSQPTAPPASTTPPRRAPTAATSAAPSPPPAVTTTGAPPAPTTKYNHLLNEDKQ